jgi:hypothetical protein
MPSFLSFLLLIKIRNPVNRNETLKVQMFDPFVTYVNMTMEDIRYTPFIRDGYNVQPVQPASNASLYLPIGQTYPLVPQGPKININHLYPGYMPNVNILVNQQHVILQAFLSPLKHLPWLRYLVSSEQEDRNEPIVYMEYPILSDAANQIMIKTVTTTSESNSNINTQAEHQEDDAVSDASNMSSTLSGDVLTSINTTTVGRLAIISSWRDLLKGILPNHILGLVTVFENACNQSFTFELVSRI